MSHSIHISLRAGEAIYVNGALLRVDRKTTLEFLNNVTFLLESHMLNPAEAKTPLQKIYLDAQQLLIEPANSFSTRQEFYRKYTEMVAGCDCPALVEGMMEVRKCINSGRNFEALKVIRRLFKVEAEHLERKQTDQKSPTVMKYGT